MQASERTLDSVGRIRKLMNNLVGQLHSDIQVLTDPQIRTILKAAEESISNSVKAIEDFEQKQSSDFNKNIYTLNPSQAPQSRL